MPRNLLYATLVVQDCTETDSVIENHNVQIFNPESNKITPFIASNPGMTADALQRQLTNNYSTFNVISLQGQFKPSIKAITDKKAAHVLQQQATLDRWIQTCQHRINLLIEKHQSGQITVDDLNTRLKSRKKWIKEAEEKKEELLIEFIMEGPCYMALFEFGVYEISSKSAADSELIFASAAESHRFNADLETYYQTLKRCESSESFASIKTEDDSDSESEAEQTPASQLPTQASRPLRATQSAPDVLSTNTRRESRPVFELQRLREKFLAGKHSQSMQNIFAGQSRASGEPASAEPSGSIIRPTTDMSI